jgi:hypothetical protein
MELKGSWLTYVGKKLMNFVVLADDTLPSSLIDSNASPRLTQRKNEELGYAL